MHFCWSTLHVKDLSKSLYFYETLLQLPIKNSMSTPDGKEIVFLGNGETQIELIQDSKVNEFDMGHSISLGFMVDSIDTMMKHLAENGFPVHSGPFSPGPFIRFFYVMDPDGLKVQFVERVQQQ